MSVSVGTDLIEIERIRRSLARYARFRERCFTEAERAYCDSRPNPAQPVAEVQPIRHCRSSGHHQ
jgi:holo-[acyl-carrier protein] synthase